MNTSLALRGMIGGVPILLAGDIAKPVHVAGSARLNLDVNRFLGELLRSSGAPPLGDWFPAVRLDALYVAYDEKTGCLSLAAQAGSFELFFVRQLQAGADGAKPYAVGMRITTPITFGSLPLLDQFPHSGLSDIGVKGLGFLYASGPGSYEIPYILQTNDLGTSPGLALTSGGFYAWAALNIAAAEQKLLDLPLPGQDSRPAPPQRVAPMAALDAPPAQDGGAASKGLSAWLDVNKTLGPVTLSRVGASYSEQKIWFLIDASLSAGGLTLTLDGLGAGSPINKFDLSVTLRGMSLSYQSGPVALSGGLVVADDSHQTFLGEMLIKAEELSLSAFGAYRNGPDYKSLFVFAMLDYPLGGPPAFFVTGLAAGFGYHSRINVPPVANLNNFLLVQDALPPAPGSSNPLAGNQSQPDKILQTLMTSHDVEPDPGEDWLAAGVRFTSFEMVQSFALITVSFGTKFEIALLGRSQISSPPDEPYPIAFAEVDLEAVILPEPPDPTTPVLAIDGVIASGSYIFAKACRLTGGFAFYVWASGEFVVTFGGYHPHFSLQPYYPRVDPLGFVWQVSDSLSMKGDLYFALTGAAIMAGGGLQAVYQSGPVVASFIAQSDFLLSWKPFHYEVAVSIHLSIALHLDLGLFTINTTFHIGVDLALHGPPFGGVANVDLDIISFSIPFGAEAPSPPPALHWEEFAGAFLPPKRQPAGGSTSGPLPARQSRRIAATSVHQDARAAGEAPSSSAIVQRAGVTGGLVKESKDGWIINPRDFEITTHTAVPATDICVNDQPITPDGEPWSRTIGILPMKATGITSTHSIRLRKRDENGDLVVYDPQFLAFEAVPGCSPKALYGNDGTQSDDARLARDTMIDKTLVGIKIRPKLQHPDQTQDVPIQSLLFTTDEVQSFERFTDPPSAIMTNPVTLADQPNLALTPTAAIVSAFSQAGYTGLIQGKGVRVTEDLPDSFERRGSR